jgi:arylsulfatase A-like enzyme
MSLRISRREFLKSLALGLAGASWLTLPAQTNSLPPSSAAPNILILVFDAFSARHASLHGYIRNTTPNLTRIADRSTVYHAHYAGGNYTTPGTASLLTGAYPWSHRALNMMGTVTDSYEDKNLFHVFASQGYHTISYSHNRLANLLLHQSRADIDVFKRMRDLCLYDAEVSDRFFFNDYTTALLSERALSPSEGKVPPASLFYSLFMSRRLDAELRQLTDEYKDFFPRGLPGVNSYFLILEHAIDWIKTQLSSWPRPFLSYLHLLPPHQPYNTRREFVDLFDDGWTPVPKPMHPLSQRQSDQSLNHKRRLYDEFIAYVDAEFGRLYDFMAQSGILDDTYLILTSDHGEMFERGIHAHITPTLYDPVVHIPLLISKPGQQRREDVYTPTSCVDLLPSLLHVTGRPIPEWSEGEVLPTFGGPEPSAERNIFSVEAKDNPKYAPLTKATVTLIKGQYKLTGYFGYDPNKDHYELFDLANDPEEMVNLYPSAGPLADDLRNEMKRKLEEVNQPYAHI